jgi:8-oxo-dGTP diphosphatase
MGKPYCPILGTLGYVLSPDRERVLMIHRNVRENDDHWGKYNGLGGKMHADEDIVTCMRREIREEAHLECDELVLRGTINWTGFGPRGEDWLGFIFRIDRFTGTPPADNPEGTLEWVSVSRLVNMELPLWVGDRYFLPMVFDDDPRAFHGYMPYDNDQPLGWNYVRM